MAKKGNWCVVPDIRPWRGDLRRDHTPYAIFDGMGRTAYASAMYAQHELEKRGVMCFVELRDA